MYFSIRWRAEDPCCGLVRQQRRKRPQETRVCVYVCMCQRESPQEASHNNAVLVSSGPQLTKRTPAVTWHPGQSTVGPSVPSNTRTVYGLRFNLLDRKRNHAVVKPRNCSMVSCTGACTHPRQILAILRCPKLFMPLNKPAVVTSDVAL